MEAVRRRKAGESAEAIALDLGVGANAVYQWAKQARDNVLNPAHFDKEGSPAGRW